MSTNADMHTDICGEQRLEDLFRDAGYAFFILSIDPYTFLQDFSKQFLVIYDLLQVQNAIIAH